MVEFRIGIDLGTTNCALAWTRTDDPAGQVEIFPIPQQSARDSLVSAVLLPSFLALPPGESLWIPGIRARALSPELPGRVISSAKSWFVHHAVDRRAPFLPLGKEEIPAESKLSPLQAAQALLQHMRSCWDDAHADAPLHKQQLAVTVPASFDPVAQQLTLEAICAAGFPENTILIEEPQAAFYAKPQKEDSPDAGFEIQVGSHVLVVDIGGGTSDFSIFRRTESGNYQRVAVGEHILLGGDNLDLSLAHFLESKLRPGETLPPLAFSRLLARAREIKEEFFSAGQSESPERVWTVAIPLPGASLLKGILRTDICSAEIAHLLLDGFFPVVGRRETPLKSSAGLREMGLPYAQDAAITRHLSAFLRGRPTVDALFFNGGTTKSPIVRQRILALIAEWQDGQCPVELVNPEPDCAVALGAARFLHLRAAGKVIESGAARACYLGVGKSEAVCILPQGTAPDVEQNAEPPRLLASLGQPVSFPLYQHGRRPDDSLGDIVQLDESFQSLPSLETMLMPPRNGRKAKQEQVRVGLRTCLRSTGVLHVSLVCREHALKWNEPWDLEFVIRDAQGTAASLRALSPETISKAAQEISKILARSGRGKLTGNFLLGVAEKELSQERNSWGAGTVRSLFDHLKERLAPPPFPPNAAEALCQLLSFLLRPGRGVPGDEERVSWLLPYLLPDSPNVPKAVRLQQWVALRRIAPGISRANAERVWHTCEADWSARKSPPTELLLLAGSLDSLPRDTRSLLAARMRALLRTTPTNDMLWRSLGRILTRFLFHTGADQILPPGDVETAWQELGKLSIPEGARKEAAACWLRAARRTGLRDVDASGEVRKGIDRLLRSWGVDDVRRRVLHDVVPLAEADQSRLLGEAPPPGLHFAESGRY